eukprot:187420-Heterocapsa_arctica.AAC.1
MGYEVQISGDYEYCLGCGRETKAKHTTSATIVHWKSICCKPVIRMERYKERKHDIIFDKWWACKGCLAKGPELNKRDCFNPTKGEDQGTDDDDGHRHKRAKCGVYN